MVIDVLNTTNKNIEKIKPKTIDDIYKTNYMMVDFSSKMKMIDREIKDFLKINMYNHKKVIINTNKGKKIIKDLFKYLIRNPKKYIVRDLLKKDSKERRLRLR